jgi:hypothetical protein
LKWRITIDLEKLVDDFIQSLIKKYNIPLVDYTNIYVGIETLITLAQLEYEREFDLYDKGD